MIKFEVNGRVAEIVIARPESGNAVTGEMARQFGEIIMQAGEKADIAILRGEGADFTVGRDRYEPKSGLPFDTFRTISAVNKAMAVFPGILVTCVRGRAFGLGVGLAMRADIAIAADDSRFLLDEVAHGIPPMFIMEEMVNHLPPKRALEIILSGREFSAYEALQMGLLSRVVPNDILDAAVTAFVEELAGRDRNVVLACKSYFRAVGKMPAEARSAFALVEQTEFALRKH